jgi:uncharacterized membrane-anchored protein
MTHSDENRIGVTATTFLALSIWLGPDLACWLISGAALVTVWVWLAARFPTVGYLTYVLFYGFVGGLISGLLGYRSGYGYHPRTCRRRR